MSEEDEVAAGPDVEDAVIHIGLQGSDHFEKPEDKLALKVNESDVD